MESVNILLIGECGMKILARGFIKHKNSYFRDGWNIIDFLVVITCIIEFFPMAEETTSLRAIKTLRAMRPLRIINAFPRLKKLVKVLLKSLPKLINVIALLSFAIILLGIFGLNFFNGNLYY